MRLLFLLSLLLTLVGVAPAAAQTAEPRVRADLIADVEEVRPGETVWVGLRQRIAPGWHTYWRNPGDAGQETRVAWTLPAGWSAGEIRWPPPTLVMVGPLANYAYSGEVVLPVPVRVPADARPGETARLRAQAAWLVCDEVCIPEAATLELALPVGTGRARTSVTGGEVAAWLARVPRPAEGATATLVPAANGRVRLAMTGLTPSLEALRAARFFPAASGRVDHAALQAIERGTDGFTLTLAPPPSPAPPPGVLDGVITFGDGRAVEVSARPGPLPAAAVGLGPVVRDVVGTGPGLGLWAALGLAFAGGLLLNLMPCVFPVLAAKAARLAAHAGDRTAARRGGVAYLAGVLLTFAALAGALIVLRGAGQAVGWGFQLQSPAVVAALALLMLLAALNLLGVFTVGAVVQGAAGATPSRSGVTGDVLTGVLAVALAAPCVAPFMAGATGWALTQGPVETLAVFLALGLGLAAPFVALAFAPSSLSRLPKPGRWMILLQRALALPMLIVVAWLVWLTSRQTGAAGTALLTAALAAAALGAWLWGRSQRGETPSRKGLARPLALAAAAVVAGLTAGLSQTATATPARAPAADLPAQVWSPQRVAALQAQGRPVFVNFTADWCVTCKVNERLTLSDPAVERALERAGAVYLVADWTLRDAAIADALAAHGRAGVPLYVVYRPDGEARILPQILTRRAVLEALG